MAKALWCVVNGEGTVECYVRSCQVVNTTILVSTT